MPSLVKRMCLAVLLLMAWRALSAGQIDPQVEGRRKALNDLLAEQWEYSLRAHPISASFLGDKRWNDKLDDFSQEAVEKDLH